MPSRWTFRLPSVFMKNVMRYVALRGERSFHTC
jgi:hypothetical protein